MKIFKYPVPLVGAFEIEMPSESVVLDVQTDNDGNPQMWVMLDPESPAKNVRFRLFWTGEHFGPEDVVGMGYAKTFQIGRMVYHMFAEMTDGPSNPDLN